jgi:hypothetical protein
MNQGKIIPGIIEEAKIGNEDDDSSDESSDS